MSGTHFIDSFKARWAGTGGYREILTIAFPLILSTGSWSIQHFVDRMFLTWYSPEAIAAAMPAGILNFTIVSFFIGIAGYVTTFVAQYHGAKQTDRIGAIVWQGIYVAAIGGVVLMAAAPLAGPLFRFFGHAPAVQENEVVYFQVLCWGSGPAIAASALSGFFSGIGKTWPVMWVNLIATLVNIVFDYLLIFGNGGFPALGMKGAAIATVLSGSVNMGSLLFLLSRPAYRQAYDPFRRWKFDRPLFLRLLKFGSPAGVQFFLDIAGFTLFILLVGRLGTESLAATNIAFNINTLAFMPMLGFGIAVSVVVGQYIGQNRPELAQRGVYSGFHMTFGYMAAVATLYVAAPGLFIEPYAAHVSAAGFDSIRRLTVVLLRFVAFYCLFDTMNIIFASALKGAGDTRFIMVLTSLLTGGLLILPTYVSMIYFEGGILTVWTIATVYVCALGSAFWWRFRQGHWKSMRVTGECPHCLTQSFPETPSAGFNS
ncbi:MAG TPA: MATE family efflux transporter [Elusimicrobiota bacterium]|nr:MATE family efflux transporter [Elusimicrobiota bacterium]